MSTSEIEAMSCGDVTSQVVLGRPGAVPIMKPLDRVSIDEALDRSGRLQVWDGCGRVYVDQPAAQGSFVTGGTLGWQCARLVNGAGKVVGAWRFRVACHTAIEDGEAGYGKLLRNLHLTMARCRPNVVAFNGKMYRYFVCWLRDHTHTLKGMKYFDGDLKTGLELYADTQRHDGMIYDRIASKASVQGWRDYTFRKGDFIRTLNADTDNSYTLQRIPVENDVEYLFIECLYRTWQATGDTAWMVQYLDHARRAVTYATTDPYRWSHPFGLLKRPYTIDTWDFMHRDDSALTLGDNVCDIDRTTFGVMHGDNTGMAASCRMLAEMLRVAGHREDADAYNALADQLLERLAQLAWDARGYYRHHISEDPSFKRDLGGTDETAQVSLSNAYALNRPIGDDKCRAIIATYQRIREQMPPASPGEFYHIYPPFEKGFGHPRAKWQYMNGGVSTIVAGELARGAFGQGHETYGVDILRRLQNLTNRHGGHLHVCFNGNPQTTPPARSFTTMDLSGVANVTASHRATGGWGEADNDLSRMPTGKVEYHHVPFHVCEDGRGIGIASTRPGYQREVRVDVGAHHASMYLLHTCSNLDTPTAELDVVYDDGQKRRIHMNPGKQLDSWFMPGSAENKGLGGFAATGHAPRLPHGWPDYQLAWRGSNNTFDNVGLFIWGWDNPRPDVPIQSLVFRAVENNSLYFVSGITFSDHPVWFPQRDLSFGIPDAWGAAAVAYALIEGLAGVVDSSVVFETVELSPRWTAANVNDVTVTVTYPASNGYVAYRYRHDSDQRRIRLRLTGSGRAITCRVLLPDGVRTANHRMEYIGASSYACVALDGVGPHNVEIAYG